MKGDDHRHFCRLMRPDAPDLDTGKPTEPGERLADDCRAASETEDVWKALKRSNRLVGRHFFICAVPMIERHGQEGRVAVIAALESWGAERGRKLRERHEERGIKVSLESLAGEHDFPARVVWSKLRARGDKAGELGNVT